MIETPANVCERCGCLCQIWIEQDGLKYCSVACAQRARHHHVTIPQPRVNATLTYLSKLCALQEEMMERYRIFIRTIQTAPQKLGDASPREWELSSRCYYLEKDNEALRELAEDYKKALHESEEKVN